MSTKIAVVTTEFLADFVTDVFTELGLDIRLYIYKSYRDIASVYKTIPPEYEGIITSGIFPAAIIMKCYPDTARTISYFNTDDAAICRLFLRRFIEDKKVDLSRVYGDFVEIIGISLIDYLTREQKTSYTNLIDPQVMEMSLEDIYLMEEAQMQKHIDLHKSGEIDFSVTRFSSIVPELLKYGFKVYFPFPSREFLKSISEKLLQDIAIKRLKDNRPAVINVSIRTTDIDIQKDSSFQLRCIALQEALLSFQGSSMLDYVLQRTNAGFEILTNQKMLSSYTVDYTVCTLSAYLKKRLSFDVSIGYGIGTDIYQARINAINAEREASLSHSGSFLINEKEELIGPLGHTDTVKASAYVPDSFSVSSETSGLSPITVSRVFSAFSSMNDGQLTAGDLSNKLAITKRSASRFLAALLNSGAIEVVSQKRPTTKGRPERVYGIVAGGR